MGALLSRLTQRKSSIDQPIFWAPEALPAIIQLQLVAGAEVEPTLGRIGFEDGIVRQTPDGWHVIMPLAGVEHRLWLCEPPDANAIYTALLPLDAHFEVRAQAARRLWRALERRAASPDPTQLTRQRRQRLLQSLRALDARHEGSTYRAIAEALFSAKRIPDQAWKTHDLRSRTIRLVQSGLALMRGGYRKLLRPRRDK